MAQEGVSRTPKDSQKTPNIPIIIMDRKLPIIHSKIKARSRRMGPVKKKMPLRKGFQVRDCKILPREEGTGKRNIRNSNKCCRSTPTHHDGCKRRSRNDESKKSVLNHLVLGSNSYPINPKGVGFAKRFRKSPTAGVFGVR